MDEVAGQPILAIDLGGTQIRAALVMPDLSVRCRRAVATHDEEGADAVIDRICALARDVLADSAARQLPAPVGIGISTPGAMLSGWAHIADIARHSIIPVTLLSAIGAAGVTRYVRTGALDVTGRHAPNATYVERT